MARKIIDYTKMTAAMDSIVERLLSEEIVIREIAPEFGVHRNTLAKCIKKNVSPEKYREIGKRGVGIRVSRLNRTYEVKRERNLAEQEIKAVYNKRYVFLKQTEKEVVSEEARKEIALVKRCLEVMREIIMDDSYVPEQL